MTVQPQKEKRLLLFAPLSRKCTLKSTVLEIGPEVAEEELKPSGFMGDISSYHMLSFWRVFFKIIKLLH